MFFCISESWWKYAFTLRKDTLICLLHGKFKTLFSYIYSGLFFCVLIVLLKYFWTSFDLNLIHVLFIREIKNEHKDENRISSSSESYKMSSNALVGIFNFYFAFHVIFQSILTFCFICFLGILISSLENTLLALIWLSIRKYKYFFFKYMYYFILNERYVVNVH